MFWLSENERFSSSYRITERMIGISAIRVGGTGLDPVTSRV